MDKQMKLKNNVLNGHEITKEEALYLYESPLEPLCCAANEIRYHFCQNTFDMCTIINGKSGRCSEDCKYCAQSSFYNTAIKEYPLLPTEEILEQAKYNDIHGVLRFSIVTSGRTLSDHEVEKICESVKAIKSKTGIDVCASLGLLSKEQFKKLKNAGITRVHNNLETSRQYFSNICTTHTFDDKINAIKAAMETGLNVCSGGIMGLGETPEDRINMAFTLRELGIKSVPINILNPIKGTPFEHNSPLTPDNIRRIAAVFRFILPDAFIRLAGGRSLLDDKGRLCFQSGANAAITGDMLTTAGISIKADKKMVQELGYKVVIFHD